MRTAKSDYAQIHNVRDTKDLGWRDARVLWLVLVSYFAGSTLFLVAFGVSEFSDLLDELMIGLLFTFTLGTIFIRGRVPVGVVWATTIAGAVFVIGSASLIANPLMNDAPRAELIATAATIDLKPFAVAFATCIVFSQARPEEIASLFFRLCLMLVALGLFNFLLMLHDLVVGVNIHGIPLQSRLGRIIPVGIYDHKYKTAFLALASLISALALRFRHKPPKMLNAATSILLLSLFVTLSVKEIVAGLFAITIYLIWRSDSKLRPLMVIAGMLTAIALLLSENLIVGALQERLTTFLRPDQLLTVRTKLYLEAPGLAVNQFPFGTGWGTFGSSAARDVFYSPHYLETGIHRLHGGGPRQGEFLVDTYWPKLLAELGFIGLALMLVFIHKVTASLLTTSFPGELSLAHFWSSAVLASFMIVSAATPVFNYADGAILCGIAIGFALSLAKFRASRYPTGKRRARSG